MARAACAVPLPAHPDEFAQRSPGLEPPEAQALLEEAIERSVNGVASFITKYHNMDGKAVIAWATEARPPREKADIARRIDFGDRRAMAQLTAAYERAQFLKACGEGKGGA